MAKETGVEQKIGARARATALLLTLLFATLIFLPIFLRGFPSGVDSDRHYRWTLQFSDALAEPGVFYPRWLGSANHNFGSPAALYYPPLTFYVAAIFARVVGDAQRAMIWSCWLALFLSGLGMYACVRSWFSHRLGLFAAALYMLAPYPLLDLYHGASVAEFWSFAWVPLVLHAVTLVAAGRGAGAVLYLAASYSLLLLTHVPVAFMLTLVLPLFALFFTPGFRRLAQIGAGMLGGLSLSAFFLLPVALEREHVRIDSLLRLDYTSYCVLQETGAALKTPLFTYDLAYYESPANDMKPAKFRYYIKNEQVAHGMALLFFFIVLVLFLHRDMIRTDRRKRRLVLAGVALTLLALFMATRYSAPVWALLPQLSFLQFPWRWLALATTGATLLSAAALSVAVRARRRRSLSLIMLAIAILLSLAMSAFVILRAPYEDGDFNPAVVRREAPEYGPVWWDSELHREEEIAPVTIQAGRADVQVIDGAGAHQTYGVRAETDVSLTFRTLYFPGWAARVDGQPKVLVPSQEGYLQIGIEPGAHQVTLTFEDTAPRRVSKIVSAMALFFLLGVLGVVVFSRRTAPKKTVQKP